MKSIEEADKVEIFCHWCNKTKVVKKEEMVTQGFTGREFCNMKCADNHLCSKGFSR